jgi:hypothetical protein
LIRSLAKTNTLLSLLLQKNDRRKQTINWTISVSQNLTFLLLQKKISYHHHA